MENDDSRPLLSRAQGSEFSCAGFQTGVKFHAGNFADANARRSFQHRSDGLVWISGGIA
jgi:hypothetical protein